MLKRLIAFLLGQLHIELTGGDHARFLSLALREGILVWGARRTGDTMRAWISLPDFFRLRPVVRGARTRVRILDRKGLPFVLVRLRRRPVLLLGAAACLAFIAWASNHVWLVKVKVTGPQNLDPRAVAAVAAEAGLRPGVWRSSVDLPKVQKHVQDRLGEISWAVIRIQGTRAVIEVVEKAAQKLPDQARCVNLVARKQGVIEQVVPFQGEPMVKKGDIVREGDLLVECSLRFWPGGRPQVIPGTPLPPRQATARTYIAQALVRARITYSHYREAALYQEVPVPTGRKAVQWVLNWNERPIILRGKEGIPFERYEEHRLTYSLPSWRNWKVPVELIILNAEEVEVRKERISPARAVSQAKEQMMAQLRWILGPSDKLLTPLQAEVVEQGKDFIGIRVTVETLEEIAQPREGHPVPMELPQQPQAKPARP